ncbi:MAG TPA: hypothetical protein VL981_00775 [Candidatus Methylacidiphilales bacterium]|nr:hypothetical protein [Candidatus Methylacidiphilales bacterium]
MKFRSLILWFLARFVLIFGLLLAPWPGWNDLYGQGFRAASNAVFGRNEEKWMIYFEAHRETRGLAAVDSRMVIGNHELANESGQGPVEMVGLDTRSIGWLPTALTSALILATPLPWRRRIWTLAWGLLWIHGFILFSVAVLIWNEASAVSLIALSPFWKTVADGLQYTLLTQLGASFTVPVIVWIATAFRQEDLRRLRLAG